MYLYKHYDAPIGRLSLVAIEGKITHLFLTTEEFEEFCKELKISEAGNCVALEEAVRQLHEYFYHGRDKFSIPLELIGTSFQKTIWTQLLKIPYGNTWSYQDVAVEIGNKNSVRAIGQANKANKLPIFIPCHRVIGKNRHLIGYAGNKTDIKAQLLRLEGLDI